MQFLIQYDVWVKKLTPFNSVYAFHFISFYLIYNSWPTPDFSSLSQPFMTALSGQLESWSLKAFTPQLVLTFLIDLLTLSEKACHSTCSAASICWKSMSDFPRLQGRSVRGQSWHSRALSRRLLVSNLGAAVGFCNASTIKARSKGGRRRGERLRGGWNRLLLVPYWELFIQWHTFLLQQVIMSEQHLCEVRKWKRLWDKCSVQVRNRKKSAFYRCSVRKRSLPEPKWMELLKITICSPEILNVVQQSLRQHARSEHKSVAV